MTERHLVLQRNGSKVRLTAGSLGLILASVLVLVWVSSSLSRSNPPGTALDDHSTEGADIVYPRGLLPTQPIAQGRPAIVNVAAEQLRSVDGTDSGTDHRPSFLLFDSLSHEDRPRISEKRIFPGIDVRRFGSLGAVSRSPSAIQDRSGLNLENGRILGNSFGELFAAIFAQPGNGEAGIWSDPFQQEVRNPFTEAMRQTESPAQRAQADPQRSRTVKASAETNTSPTSLQAGGNVSPPDPRFLFLGDWSGSGQLKSISAVRVGETTFSFPEGRRSFRLYVNPSAVEYQRSFAIEDITGDGIPDLIVTARASLFGGVLMGDGQGDYFVQDTFLSGYEPVIATAGAVRGNRREILALNARTGVLSAFRAGDRYRFFGKLALDFLPDYIGHLVEQGQGIDYFMAAKVGQPSRTFELREHSLMEASSLSLPSEPSLLANRNFSSNGNSPGSLQVFQVGGYASIILTNGRGEMFNVANLRVVPEIFLAVGDFDDDGSIDVAVAQIR